MTKTSHPSFSTTLKTELDIQRFALDCSGNFIWVWSLDSGVIDIIGSAKKHLGLEFEDNQTTIDWWWSSIHKDDREKSHEGLMQLLKGEIEHYQHTYRIKNVHGQWVSLSSKAQVFERHSNGRVKTLLGFEHFINDIQELEQQLERSTSNYIDALSGDLDTVWEWNLTTDVVKLSDVWKLSFGLDLNSPFYFKESWRTRVHPDDIESINVALLDVLKGKRKFFNSEHRVLFNDNTYHWCLIRGSVHGRAENGRALKMVGIMSEISLQKRQEDEQRKLFEQFALTLHSTECSSIEYDLKNQQYTHISFDVNEGKIVQNISQHPFSVNAKTLHPDDYNVVKQFYDDLHKPGSNIRQAKWRSSYKSDHFNWYETRIRSVEFDSEGNPTKALGIRQNITQQEIHALETEKTRLRDEAAYKDTFHCVWEWNIKTNELYFSAHFIDKITEHPETWSYSLSDWEKTVHPDDLIKASKQLEEQLSAPRPFVNIIYRIRSIKGNWVWVKGEGQIVEFDDDNKPVRGIGTIIDITQQKQAELALAYEKDIAQTTLESINEAVITTNAIGRIISINHKAQQLLETNTSEALGNDLDSLCALSDEQSSKATHPIQQCLKSDVAFDLTNFILINKLSKRYLVDCSVSPIHNSTDTLIGCIMVIRDMTKSRLISQEIEHRAKHDPLTGIFNRHAFESVLEQNTQHNDFNHMLCYIDLDQFKIINDTCGHVAGDELLRQLSTELSKKIRKSDVFARLGGDEFGLLILDCNAEHALKIAEGIKEIITEYTFQWEDKAFKLGASIGLASIDQNTTATVAMQHADTACFTAKEQGRDRIHVFQSDDSAIATRDQMGWVPRLQSALRDDRFTLFVQSIIDLKSPSSEPTHFEILVRLHENGKIAPPGAFLPAAERYNLAHQIDRWVVKNTLVMLSDNRHAICPSEMYNINLSAASLCDDQFLDFVKTTFSKTNVNPAQICFEITETAAVTNLTAANTLITALKTMGCQFALDDFGSGLSSFGYLKSFPVDYLKIDGSFVKDLMTDPIDAAMVKSINEIGQIMGKRTVAEFVENQDIANKLIEMGVDYAQGYHYSTPSPLDELLAIKSNKTKETA